MKPSHGVSGSDVHISSCANKELGFLVAAVGSHYLLGLSLCLLRGGVRGLNRCRAGDLHSLFAVKSPLYSSKR